MIARPLLPANHSAATRVGRLCRLVAALLNRLNLTIDPIEGEALAVADALDRTRYFVLGCKDLTVVVDHKPLLCFLENRSREAKTTHVSPNLKENTLRYQFKMMYIPGDKNKASGCMSRRPSDTRYPEQP